MNLKGNVMSDVTSLDDSYLMAARRRKLICLTEAFNSQSHDFAYGSQAFNAKAAKFYRHRSYLLCRNGAQGRNRTTDTRIFNPLLYP